MSGAPTCGRPHDADAPRDYRGRALPLPEQAPPRRQPAPDYPPSKRDRLQDTLIWAGTAFAWGCLAGFVGARLWP